ncbi:prepilin-type N-terminal cleavage/methylation domain-containing protein [Iodobacter sp. HSC-16F04]|uniref:Type II secretion system protein H n=1 Tax=Iodobacter violaceini TaxID=3044271 RepID=A0ABX0KTC4_9NEIS|nr:GspH/FimT family pseudopilin [Iodobacter violacea]NHQ85717.1 prepilin-type N-terminal cleavage/methylation domain-containing protein [Iodobacter violacea]
MDLHFPQRNQQGFTLVEILITLLIFGILLSLAGPPFQGWVRSTQLRTYAESFQSAVQLARAEAIKRNGYVELILTNDAVAATNRNANNVSPSVDGTAWLIRACPACVNLTTAAPAGSRYPFIEGKTVAEGNSAQFKLTADQSMIRFDALGRADQSLLLIVSADKSAVADCNKKPADGSTVKNPARICMRVDEGGNTQLCLPDAPKKNPASCSR